MKKNTFILFITLLLATFSAFAQEKTTNITVGGNPIKFPAPTAQFKEVGEEQRSLFNAFVPESNKLLCVFLDTSDYNRLSSGNTEGIVMEKYMLIEVNSQVESTNLGLDDFADVKKGVASSLKTDMNEIIEDANKILKLKLEDNADVEIGKPNYLGCIYETKESYGLLMSFNIKSETKTVKKLCSLNFLRLNNRLIYIYVYCNFDDITKVKWLKNISESWAKEILKAN